MREYTDEEVEEIIKEIESDPDIDKKWGSLIKGHVVEIRYVGGVKEVQHNTIVITVAETATKTKLI